MESLNEQPPVRLDVFLCAQAAGLSRTEASRLIDAGYVRINGHTIKKASTKVRPEDSIIIDEAFLKKPVPPQIDIEIIYEDKDCLVINKPPGVLTHSKGAYNPEATVATWLSERISLPAGDRAGIVHRLDRPTSGIMICARTKESMSWLQKQFSQRKVKKIYLAVVEGKPKTPEAVIEMPIERNPTKPQQFRVGGNGKPAITQYKVLASNENFSLIELKPVTGRTHQLRVHMKQIGHPVAGDVFYGAKPAERLYLHASSLEITLPSRERKVFSAPTPKDFTKLADND